MNVLPQDTNEHSIRAKRIKESFVFILFRLANRTEESDKVF